MSSDAERLEIPTDPWAEAAVVGCAIASSRGADLARSRLGPSDIWDPRLARLLGAALEISIEDHDARIQAVAEATGIPVAEVDAMVESRPVMADVSGSFARRVMNASRRRAAMTAAANVYNALAAGARLEELSADIHELEQAAAC